MAGDEKPGDMFQSTDGVYLRYANQEIPTFRRDLTVKPDYVSLGSKIPLALGNPEKCPQAKALEGQMEAYRASMRTRYETAITLMNNFSASLRDVETKHRDAEDDSTVMGGALADEFSEILTPKGK
ncbi:hypothetical protein GCM10015535_37330 [Streptomyces gelaticus]|uniref:Uncharacterized protein n=1 Tax=Streptomyces gelaticus TaxID=285446 RepID=A0ABQ2W3L7_9ACTN|nr:hypothetical protein [Streptomyces gelaticus]GGV87516.1 hypothetical protein GCM10015535_37330 [Streptomyces gelaticus]